AVILAAHDIFATAAESDGSGAVAAHVTERAKSSLFVAHHQERFASHIGGEKSFRIGNVFLNGLAISQGDFTTRMVERADKLPGAAKDFFFLDFENSWI